MRFHPEFKTVLDAVNTHCAFCGERITRWFEHPIIVRGLRVCKPKCAQQMEAKEPELEPSLTLGMAGERFGGVS